MDIQLHSFMRDFDISQFAKRHGGHKESQSVNSFEYQFMCRCGSSRLFYNSQKLVWRCWVCGKRGDLFELVSWLEGCTEEAALEAVMDGQIAGNACLDRLESNLAGPVGVSRRQALRLLPPRPWPNGVEKLTEPCVPHKHAWEYLINERGLSKEQIRRYDLRIGRMGRFAGYVLFPVYMDRALVYYQGRATWDPPEHLKGEDRKQWKKDNNYKKTLNPINQGDYAKASEVIFNFDRASVQETVVINEGPTDAICVGENAVALFGKIASPSKIERLSRMAASRYVIYLDYGSEEAESAIKIGKELSVFGRVDLISPPPGFDPANFTRAQNAEILRYSERYDPEKMYASVG